MENEAKPINVCKQVATKSISYAYKIQYVWVINNFSADEAKNCGGLKSDIFSTNLLDTLKWRMYLDILDNETSDLLRIRVKLLSCRRISAEFSVGCLNADGETGSEGSLATMFPAKNQKEAIAMVPVKYLMNVKTLLPNNVLSISCKITIKLDEMEEMKEKSGLSLDLGQLLESEEFSDIKLVVGSSEFHAHKSILSSRSSVFAAMLKHDMLESRSNVIEIKDVEPDVMRELLKYIYTDEVENMFELAGELYLAADKYDLANLKVSCVNALANGIDVDNITHILMLADKFRISELRAQAIQFFLDNKKDVKDSVEYKTLKEEQLNWITELVSNC